MTIPTHILFGLLLGKISGQYATALSLSVALDFDHFPSYIRSGILFRPQSFWKTITDEKDPYGNQRGYIHTIYAWVLSSALCFFFLPEIATTFSLAYLGHLMLDALDTADWWPLYPYKGINIKGPLQYFSRYEIVLAISFLCLWLLL